MFGRLQTFNCASVVCLVILKIMAANRDSVRQVKIYVRQPWIFSSQQSFFHGNSDCGVCRTINGNIACCCLKIGAPKRLLSALSGNKRDYLCLEKEWLFRQFDVWNRKTREQNYVHLFAYKLRDFFVKVKSTKIDKVARQATVSPLPHSISRLQIPQNYDLQIYNEISFTSITCATDAASTCSPLAKPYNKFHRTLPCNQFNSNQ